MSGSGWKRREGRRTPVSSPTNFRQPQTAKLLHERKIPLRNRPFSVSLSLAHRQEIIDMHERVQQHVINLTGVKLPERNRGTTARSSGFDFIVGKGERERERRRLFKQKEIQKGREGAQRGNDFLSLSLSLSLYQLLRRGKM